MVCICALSSWLISICGIFLLAKGAYRLYQLVKVHWILKELDLAQRYGKGSWVLITASSDGIGGALATAFAKRGFNIILNGRTLDKIKVKQDEIKEQSPSVQTKALVRDFSQCAQPGFFEGIYQELKGLDISILVNNVGIAAGNLPGIQKAEDIQSTVIVNTVAQTMMWHHFSSDLQVRKQRSAIIDLSSLKALGPSNFAPLYVATKAFNKYLLHSLGYTLRYQNIDKLCLTPGFISTSLIASLPVTKLTSSAEDCAESVMRVLGQTEQSYTTKKSAIHGMVNEFLYFMLPGRYAAKLALMFYGLILKKELKAPDSSKKQNQS